MQFVGDRQDKRGHAPEIVDVGRSVLQNLDFARNLRREDHHLQLVAAVCAAGEKGYGVAKAVCENLKRAVVLNKTYASDYGRLLKGLCKVQPKAVLDALLTGDREAVEAGSHLIDQSGYPQSSPIDEVSEDTLFDWCGEDPIDRFPAVASVVHAFTLSADGSPSAWTPIASRLVHSAPNPLAVMQTLVKRMRPMTWSGSRSTILQMNVTLLDQFDVQGNEALASFIVAQKATLQQEAHEDLDWETKLDRERDETFE